MQHRAREMVQQLSALATLQRPDVAASNHLVVTPFQVIHCPFLASSGIAQTGALT